MPALPMGVPSALPTTPASRLLALWLAVTVLVCLALGALALLVARQSRALQADRARDTTERMLLAHRDTVAARITSLASWLVQVGTSRATASAPDWTHDREVLVLVSGTSGASLVHGTWLFTPDGSDGLDPIAMAHRAARRNRTTSITRLSTRSSKASVCDRTTSIPSA